MEKMYKQKQQNANAKMGVEWQFKNGGSRKLPQRNAKEHKKDLLLILCTARSKWDISRHGCAPRRNFWQLGAL